MKERFEKTLAKLKELCREQDAPAEIFEALGKVQNYVSTELTIPAAKSTAKSESFSLPREVTGENEAYAIFSDGACRGNPGPGAWGCMAQDQTGELLFEASGVEHQTTNNKMEIQGAIEAFTKLLEHLQENGLSEQSPVYFYCDSRYVVDGLSSWIPGWKRRGWKKADKKAPENLELWQQLDRMASYFPHLKNIWVKAHAGHPQNERCDQLANQALDELGY